VILLKNKAFVEMRLNFFFILTALLYCLVSTAQGKDATKTFTHADTLRGSITAGRAWWDLLRYDLTIKPDFNNKSTEGKNSISYKVISTKNTSSLQLDLQEPLVIDSVILNAKTSLKFTKKGNAWFLKMPVQQKGSVIAANHMKLFGHPGMAAGPLPKIHWTGPG
jgi:hypothetical protein